VVEIMVVVSTALPPQAKR